MYRSTIVCLFALLGLLWHAHASIQYRGNTEDKQNSGHCYYEELELRVAVNETVLPTNKENFCVSVFCRDDFVLMVRHCDRIVARKGCDITPYDYTQPFPSCCLRMVCH